MTDRLRAALAGFDAASFARRHGGFKESRSALSHEYMLTCPSCGSSRLRWRHDPHGKQAWICWGCRASGDTLALVRALEKTSDAGAIEYVLAGYCGGDSPTTLTAVRAERARAPSIGPMPWPEHVDLLTPRASQAWDYAMRRGLTPAQITRYRIGVGTRGRLDRYVVFPIFVDGALMYWQARAAWDPPNLPAEERKQWIRETQYRKTLNPFAVEGHATAADVVFGFDFARAAQHVVICEGPIDAMRVGEHAVALLGKVATAAKVARLLRLHAQRYTVYLDRGAEERAQALALARQIAAYAPTYIATPPEGHDPGSLTPTENAAVVASAERLHAGQI